MRKIIAFILCISLCLCLTSCEQNPDAYALLGEFAAVYGAQGVIYSPKISEGNDGYVYEGLVEKIYVFSGRFPDNYAILLNSRPDFSSECAIFVCTDVEMLYMVEEMCLERIRILCGRDECAFVKRSGSIVFYSTMKDREKAERIFSEIIR